MLVIVNSSSGEIAIKIEKKFGRLVRELRGKAGYSQEELADLAGIHRTYLGGIERGERNPSLKIIERIAKALKVPIYELFRF